MSVDDVKLVKNTRLRQTRLCAVFLERARARRRRTMESDNIAIFVRVRKQREDAGAKSVSTDPVKGTVVLHTPTEDRTFSFDRVGGEATTQEEVFEAVGQPLSDACMAGYNAAIFAYGQRRARSTRADAASARLSVRLDGARRAQDRRTAQLSVHRLASRDS